MIRPRSEVDGRDKARKALTSYMIRIELYSMSHSIESSGENILRSQAHLL